MEGDDGGVVTRVILTAQAIVSRGQLELRQ
jgi:hypothetical protein